jgi:hypothetical protein
MRRMLAAESQVQGTPAHEGGWVKQGGIWYSLSLRNRLCRLISTVTFTRARVRAENVHTRFIDSLL